MQRIVRQETAAVSQNPTPSSSPAPAEEQRANSRAISRRVVEKQMRYAVRRTPEERRDQKLKFFEDSDDDGDAAMEPVPKKHKTIREVTMEAQEAHTKMCGKAVEGLEKMSRILDKLDRKLNEM